MVSIIIETSPETQGGMRRGRSARDIRVMIARLPRGRYPISGVRIPRREGEKPYGAPRLGGDYPSGILGDWIGEGRGLVFFVQCLGY